MPQSTRETMRRAVKRSITHVDQAMENLMTLDDIAGDKSDYVKGFLPVITTGLINVEKVLKLFLKGL